jgi:hypothetical protein
VAAGAPSSSTLSTNIERGRTQSHALTIARSVDDQVFFGLRVAGDPQYVVLAALVVPISA